MQERTLPEILGELNGKNAPATLTPSWMQGRAAFGGIAAALAVRGMNLEVGPGKSLRSLMVSFVAPAPAGQVTVAAELVRSGKSVTQASSHLLADGIVCTQAMAAYGEGRETKSVAPKTAFRGEPRESVPAIDISTGVFPAFLAHFDVHWTGGGIPGTNQKALRSGQWVRHKADMSAYPIEKLVAVADIPPPVMMSHYDRFIRASSLSWSLEFVMAPETVDSDWFYLDYTLEAAADGYSQQSGQIFTEDGRLVALSRQCMVYFE
jgi:acyl-CoA thioesterase